MERDTLVLVVGPPSEDRARMESVIRDQDLSVVMCPGPTPCPTLDHRTCGLAGLADAVVVMNQEDATLPVRVGLARCAAIPPVSEIDHGIESIEDIAGRVGAKLRHPSALA